MFFPKAPRGSFDVGASLRAVSRRERTQALSLQFLVGLSLFVSGCGGTCRGDDCGCEGLDECIIDCQRDGCDLQCARASSSCGAICNDDCSFECSETDHCSSYSGDDSEILCRNLPTCASECGKRCDYTAEDVSALNLTVGDRSEVTCRRIGECNVDCSGSCDVEADNVGRWHVECSDGSEHEGVGSGSIRCE